MVAGIVLVLFIISGVRTGGIGLVVVFLVISAALTGLYILLTGPGVLAGLPLKRKAGVVTVATSFAVLISLVLSTPRTSTDEPEAATADSTASTTSTAASETATATPTVSSTAQETGAPLDPETPSALAQGLVVAAPNAEPAVTQE